MKEFKKLMMACHTQNKACLHDLYTDKQVYYSSVRSSEQPVADEKIYRYRAVSFQFTGTGYRTPEQMILYVWIPEEICREPGGIPAFRTACEDWLLRLLGAPVNALSEDLQNDHKDAREHSSFSMQEPGSIVLARNGCLYIGERHAFRLRISCVFPLINGHSLNGKGGYKAVKAVLDLICDRLETADQSDLAEHVLLYSRQRRIRAFLRENGLLAFIANGSILPRQGATQIPLPGAIPFQSPASLRITIHMPDGYSVTGMGLKQGITVITGGGYSGKSTLLDCLEQGIYDHVRGDGREYVISDETSCKVYAEDGRYLEPTDLSPFFTCLPGNNNPHRFATSHASGSVSQAANIVEAVYGGSRCLLIDEDTSATNFMIRDETMRRLVKKDPIVPFTDRISELADMGVSTILVIGGSGEYLKCAQRVLLLEDYLVSDVTEQIRGTGQSEPCHGTQRTDKDGQPATDIRTQQTTGSEQPATDVKAQQTAGSGQPATDIRTQQTTGSGQPVTDAGTHSWMRSKCLPCAGENKAFVPGQFIQIENAHYLKIGGFTADITRLTAITESGQPGSLIWLLEKLLFADGGTDMDLRVKCEAMMETLFSDSLDTVLSSRLHHYDLWLEQVRSLDLIMAACRLRPDARIFADPSRQYG